MDLFNRLNKCEKPEPIDEIEGLWINNATCGAMVYGEKGYVGEAYKYDIISMYPSIMCSKNMSFPLTSGTFRNITIDEEEQIQFYACGIYRCTIDIQNNKMIRSNKNNYYTHITMNQAIALKYKVSLIHDNEHNALQYNNCIIGSHIFGEFVDIIFPLKQAGNKRAKRYGGHCVSKIL